MKTVCVFLFMLCPPITGTIFQDTATTYDEVESKEILERAPVTQRSEVKHVLIGWKELADVYMGRMDPRGLKRTYEEAGQLALQILKQSNKGTPFEELMKRYSEDPGSAADGRSYTATPTSTLVPSFKKLSLRLKVGETGIARTKYGYHVIKRVR